MNAIARNGFTDAWSAIAAGMPARKRCFVFLRIGIRRDVRAWGGCKCKRQGKSPSLMDGIDGGSVSMLAVRME
jgi:hypothetical protein